MAMLTLREVLRLNVHGVRPETLAKLTELMREAETQLGLSTFVRDFGGYRGAGVQAQLVAWRNEADAQDGIIGGGRDYYAVAPAGTSHHEYGAAFDLGIVAPSQRTDANYRAIADISRRIGLRPGYYFTRKDEFHHELSESLATVKTKWRALMRERAALVAVGVLLTAFFFLRARRSPPR